MIKLDIFLHQKAPALIQYEEKHIFSMIRIDSEPSWSCDFLSKHFEMVYPEIYDHDC